MTCLLPFFLLFMAMKKRIYLVVLLLLCSFAVASAQRGTSHVRTNYKDKNYVDTTATMVWTGVNMAGHLPMGDLKSWFKPNLSVGTGLTVKTKGNWTFDMAGNYMFGANLRDKSAAFLGDIVSEAGGDHIVLDGNGLQAKIYLEGRYWQFGANVGKVIPVNRWKNSGVWVRLGAGYFGHKIRINDYDNQVPQLDGNYKKGYDHLSGGFALNQFVGYLFIQKNRVLNFYGGIEFYEIWSKPTRNYIINEGSTADLKYKFSGLVGLKIGWNIPLYEKKSVTTFYYR